MTTFEAKDPDYEERVRASFNRQKAMQTLGFTLSKVTPGEVEMIVPYREDLTQQHGFMHGGIVATGLDNVCGYAAFSLTHGDIAVLSVEFKVNLLSPASGETFVFRGSVIKPGRTITVCEARAYGVTDGVEKLIATATGTIMSVASREGLHH